MVARRADRPRIEAPKPPTQRDRMRTLLSTGTISGRTLSGAGLARILSDSGVTPLAWEDALDDPDCMDAAVSAVLDRGYRIRRGPRGGMTVSR